MTPTELREALDMLMMSQAGLARILGVKPFTVNRWCQGTTAVPSYVSAYLAAASHGRYLSTLLDEARDYIAHQAELEAAQPADKLTEGRTEPGDAA